MLPTPTELYLPLSESTLLTVLNDAGSLENALQALGIPEIACLFLLTYLPVIREHKRKNKPALAERMLAVTIESCHQQVDKADLSELVSYASQNLKRKAISTGYDLLPTLSISLLDDEAVKDKAYVSGTGRWDYSFQQRYRENLASQQINTLVDGRNRSLSAEQSRVYLEFEAQADEHIHIQGYAGTGKSTLIKSLLNLFEASSAQVLLLASHKRQLDALLISSHNMPHVSQCTFTALADMVMAANLESATNRRMLGNKSARNIMPDELIVRQLGIKASAAQSADYLIKAVRASVYRFCQSGDARITEKHIPHTYYRSFDNTLRAVVCHYANELWNTLLSPPTKDFSPQIRGYHKIKWVALNGWAIPSLYTHVIVDECHDLPQPVLEILACSPQARVTLGDDYQNLGGRTFRQADHIRLREMSHSYRSGQAIESIVNPIIAAHPSKMKAQFQGNSLSKLAINYYHKATIPSVPSLILVRDNWGLFEWVQRLASQNINPVLLSDHNDLNRFVQDCFELKSGGSRARHGELFRYNSWDALASAYQSSAGFRRFNQLLEKGYSQSHWQQTFKRLSAPNARTHVVSIVKNARNREFDNVMLAPDVFDVADMRSKVAFSATIYVGVTRARKQLMAPQELQQWIEEISETKSVDHKTNRRSKA